MSSLARALPLICMLLAWSLPAAAEIDLSLEASAATIEVGQTVVVRAKALSSDDAPNHPELRVPSAFVQQGPSIGTSHQVSFVNGRVQRLTGITATWELTARRTGTFTLGPASVAGPNGRVSSQTVTVQVVAAGSLPAPAPRRRRSLFDDDFLGPSRRPLIDELLGRAGRGLPEAPAEYRLERAPDRDAFLHAELSQDSAVVGEQVTLTIYAYGGRGAFHEGSPREPRRPAFYSYPLVENSGRQQSFSVEIEGRDYQTVLVRKFALFPLQSGTLEIGPMEMMFVGPGYRSRGNADGLVRKSPTLTLRVTEPPEADRPPGYQLGDVGNYRLEAQVQPTRLSAGQSLSVTATLEGRGHLPSHLLTPEQKGVRWLEPTITDGVGVNPQGVVRGSRTFTYVVQIDRPGKIDLGELRLPYYNPNARAYGVARASLGTIDVDPMAADPTATDTARSEPPNVLSSSMAPRATLGEQPEPAQPLSSWPWFWWSVVGTPLGVALLSGTSSVVTGWLRRGKLRKESAGRRSAEAWTLARAAVERGDVKAACSAIERALFLGIEDKTGLKGRALLRDELGDRLIELGCLPAAARELQDVLQAVDELRFGQRQANEHQLLSRGERALKGLDVARRAT